MEDERFKRQNTNSQEELEKRGEDNIDTERHLKDDF